jgi:hypothetical protein
MNVLHVEFRAALVNEREPTSVIISDLVHIERGEFFGLVTSTLLGRLAVSYLGIGPCWILWHSYTLSTQSTRRYK